MMGTKSFILLAASTVFYLAIAEPKNVADLSELQMKQIWSNCMLGFLGMKSIGSASELIIVDNSLEYSIEPQWEDMQRTLDHLTPEKKRSLIDCLIKQGVSRDISIMNQYSIHLLRKLKQETLSRRRLASTTLRQTAHANDPSPTPSLMLRHAIQTPSIAPASVLASVPDAAPAPIQDIRVKWHASSPSSPPSEPPIPEDDPEDFSTGSSPDNYNLEPEVFHPTPPLYAAPSEKGTSSVQTIIIAVAATAAVTFALAALCFCCCNRYALNKYQTVNGQKDEKPILSSSLSDFFDSPQNNFGLDKDKFGSLYLKADSNQCAQLTSFSTSAESHSTTNIPLPPAAPPPPPLKPPPGKPSAPPPAPPPPILKPKSAPPPPKGGPPLPKNSSQASLTNTFTDPHTNNSSKLNADADGAKTKLKPFFWDKVMANPDQSMVWHQLKAGSFQFNEEMIETLFGYNVESRHDAKKDFGNDSSSQRIQILDPKKSQNLAISLRAQNVKIEEVCEALIEGNELPIELLQTLLRMAPTSDEELKLRLFNDDSAFLGPAEQFLKAMMSIPFAFKRMDALLFMTSLQEESSSVKESFATLEEACKDLRHSRLFLKLLEAVLKTGNRMNNGTYRGGAQAFKLDTLLKLSDVKGTDGKTTLLHFVAQEIIRSEGRRAVRLANDNRSNSNITTSSVNSDEFADDTPEESEEQYRILGFRAISNLSYELNNVKKAAGLDTESLTASASSLGNRLVKTKEFLNTDMSNLNEESGFHNSLKAFVEHAEADIAHLLEEEKRLKSLVKQTTDYFHGSAGRDEGLRLFVIVRDFLEILEKVCKEVRESQKKVMHTPRSKDNLTLKSSSNSRQLLFPAIRDRRMEDSGSEDD